MKGIQFSLAMTVLFASMLPATGKEIERSVIPGQNKVFIRTDGLACYFCAYGLERFFKQTGRIAAFDVQMTEGIVEVALIGGKPLVSARDFRRYVHDAGFTPRSIRVELVGRFVREGGALSFEVAETGERLPVDKGGTEELPEGVVRVQAEGLEHASAPFALNLEKYEKVKAKRP